MRKKLLEGRSYLTSTSSILNFGIDPYLSVITSVWITNVPTESQERPTVGYASQNFHGL